jgi:hypothetical protein
MTLNQIAGRFSIAKYAPDAQIAPLFSRRFCSITRTTTEVTVVCETDLLPPGMLHREDGWLCLQVDGTWDFDISKVVQSVGRSLSLSEISLFLVSTVETDYVLIQEKVVHKIADALQKAGITIS